MSVPTQRDDAAAAAFDRRPPGSQPDDIYAEQATLGGMLLDPDVIGDVIEALQSGADFYEWRHETIYNAILDRYSKGLPVDPVVLGGDLHKTGELAKIGGGPYLHTLVQSVPTAANAAYHAGMVAEAAVARRIISTGTRIARIGYERLDDTEGMVDAVQAEAFQLAQNRADETLEHARYGLDQTFDDIEAAGKRGPGEISGIPTGFDDLNAVTNGLQPGQMIVIAGRPAMGKTTLGLDIARACALKAKKPAVFFSLEMGRKELHQRMLSAEGSVALHHVMGGNLDEKQWDRLAKARAVIDESELYIDDSPELTMMAIRTKARRLMQRAPLGLIVIDYLQLMEMGSGRRAESRQQEVSDMSRSLKMLAKELQVPIVALAQLNRGPEQRTDKKPMVSDLRESGSIEQDADIVILLHREDAYEKESPRAGEADLIIGKHRNGPTATITVAFQGHYSRFVDMNQH